MHHMYIVRCADDTLYTGYTTDVERRVSEHNAGTGAKYTRGRGPVVLEYVEEFSSKSEALRREYEVKQCSRGQKEQLISSGERI